MLKNPHMSLVALSPPGTENRIWKCTYCHEEGLMDEIRKTECSFVYPPCEHCGQTPECALDCSGIAMLLADPRVHLVK